MITSRFSVRVLATLTLWAGFGLTASAQLPALTLDKAFETKPRQPGVAITTPAPDQIARHKVDPIPNPKQPGSNMGYVVRDADNKPVRQFVSYDGKSFNIIAFYVNGQETYREVYPPTPNEPYQFRWLGSNGGKWGLDKDRDGRVDEWVVISPEEASQEIMQAVLTRDPKRLDALLPNESHLTGIGLPAAEIARIKDKAAGAVKRMTDAATALNLSAEAKWVHLELGIPQTTPADAFNGKDDQVVHKNGTILIEDKGKTHFLQTGELILVGRSWKAVEGPQAGPGGADSGAPGVGPTIVPAIAELVKQLDELDKAAATLQPAQMAEYYGKRAGILEQIVQKLPPKDQTDWARLLIDSLASAAEGGKADAPAHQRLKQLRDTFLKDGPASPLGAYVSFRLIVAENGIALAEAKGGKELQAVQEKWRTGLEAFINAHPKSEDAGEAVLRLAMAYEFLGKDGEEKAKTWCKHLVQNYPQHHHAAKANGIVKRLESEGKLLELAGTNMATNQPFNVTQVPGKAVVVFYWASWSTTIVEDAKKLKDIAATYGPKGLEVVCVALDDDAAAVGKAIQAAGLPGIHLHAKGGLDASPLATGYGILVVPHIIIAGKDGKVAKRSGDISTLEDDVKSLLK